METYFQNAPLKASLDANKEYWYCTCGQSKTFPFCDRNHEGTNKTPINGSVDAEDQDENLIVTARINKGAKETSPSEMPVTAMSPTR